MKLSAKEPPECLTKRASQIQTTLGNCGSHVSISAFLNEPHEWFAGDLLPISKGVFEICDVFSGPLAEAFRDISTSVGGHGRYLAPSCCDSIGKRKGHRSRNERQVHGLVGPPPRAPHRHALERSWKRFPIGITQSMWIFFTIRYNDAARKSHEFHNRT